MLWLLSLSLGLGLSPQGVTQLQCSPARTAARCAQLHCTWCPTLSGAGACTALPQCPPSLLSPKSPWPAAQQPGEATAPAPSVSTPCDGSPASAALPAAECAGWQDFHGGTNGTNWQFGCQHSFADPCNCSYTVQGLPAGVTCEDGHITSLQFAFNGLQGALSDSLGDLSHVTSFVACGNGALAGSLPASMVKNMAGLTELDVSGCAMTGTIPDVSSLTQLFSLTLYDNFFQGTLPSVSAGMRMLANFALDHNALTGAIPDSLASAPSLYGIVLGSNQLSGTVPASIAQCRKLQVLSLEDNALDGVPPALPWAQFDAMCDLTNNNFTCPCKNATACAADANWMSARKHCNASCHYA